MRSLPPSCRSSAVLSGMPSWIPFSVGVVSALSSSPQCLARECYFGFVVDGRTGCLQSPSVMSRQPTLMPPDSPSFVCHRPPRRFVVFKDSEELLEDLRLLLLFGGRCGDRASHGFDEVGRRADCEICFGDGRRSAIRRVYFSHGRGDAVGITHVKLLKSIM